MEYNERAVERFRADLGRQKAAFEAQIGILQGDISALRQAARQQLTAVAWLHRAFRRAATLLAEAREGKLDSFVVNEQEVVQYLLQYGEDVSSVLRRERMRVHTCLILADDQVPKNVPGYIVALAAEGERAAEGSTGGIFDSSRTNGNRANFSRPTSALALSERPTSSLSSRTARNANPHQGQKLIQPKMQTGYIKAKAPDVHLNMNVHISPRPQSSASQRSTVKMAGSCGGTQELVNK